jgi:L-ascorbate metabolism protein UlaG (beta-lactamase superfamily)
MSVGITWLGHASVLLTYDGFNVYVDPWKVAPFLPKADLVLITHDHYDHFSPVDVKRVATEQTRIAGPLAMPLITDRLKPGDALTVGAASVEAVPAYNIDKAFHPRANNWVGYIVTLGGQRIYHTGDTDRIPEMQNLRADVVLMPVGGTYTMDAQTASLAVNDLNPALVIPIHYGDIVGSRQDAEQFRDYCACAVRILQAGETVSVG